MVLNMRMKDEISPTLRNIVNRFDEDNIRPSDFQSSGYKSADDAVYNDEVEFDGDQINYSGTWSHNHGDETTMVDEGLNHADSTYPDYHEVFVTKTMHGIDSLQIKLFSFSQSLSNYLRTKQ